MSELSTPECSTSHMKLTNLGMPALTSNLPATDQQQNPAAKQKSCATTVAHQLPARPASYVADCTMNGFDRFCQRVVQQNILRMGFQDLKLIESGETPSQALAAVHVHDPKFFRRILFGGTLGAGESYMHGEWSTDNLVELIRMLSQNMSSLDNIESHWMSMLSPFKLGLKWLNRNSRSGSRKNIAAHYDLSNDFFELMLDPSMTYSSGIFFRPTATMEEASLAKYERICRKLELTQADHVIEIGTGWGGFAIYAAKQYGCRITTTTISRQQYDYARDRISNAGLTGQINLLLKDYRDLKGTFDKLVSIEMIEAVGEKYLDGYFQQCSRLLIPTGMMVLQAITMPDHRYDVYRRSFDFIQKYIFPGGFLPAFSAITQSIRSKTDLRLSHSEDFGPHYAETLKHWRTKFWNNIQQIRNLGFDERFIRMWHFYLCYCEAAFWERQVGVSQILLTKPGCRRMPFIESQL